MQSTHWMKILVTVLLLAPLGLAWQAGAQQAPTAFTQESGQLGLWLARAARAYETGDDETWVEAVEHLHRMRPHNPDFMYQLVTGYARTGQTQKAFDMMLRMQQQGLAYDWDQNEDLEPLRRHGLYAHLNSLMREAGQPFGEAGVVARLGAEVAMPEALAFDAGSNRLFVGTVRDGRILVRANGDWEEFAAPGRTDGLMAVFDLLADPARGHLWVATGMTSQFRGFRQSDFGRTALIKLDLDSGKRLGEYRVLPDGHPHLLGALTLGPEGEIYAADSLSPVIYRLEPGAERPVPFVSHPVFTGLRGIAVSGDGAQLYVADYELGLFLIETEGRKAFALGIPEHLNLAGIDGVYWWNNSLIVIQNGISPERIVRLELDDSGTRVANVVPLVAALPEFDIPTFGTLNGAELIFLAASQWHKVDGRGRPLEGRLPETPVMMTRVDSTQAMVVGKEVLEQLRREGRPVAPQH